MVYIVKIKLIFHEHIFYISRYAKFILKHHFVYGSTLQCAQIKYWLTEFKNTICQKA